MPSQKSLKKFIEESESRLAVVIANAQEKLDSFNEGCVEISSKKDIAQSELGAIQQVKTSANAIITELQQYKTQFEQIRTQLDDSDDGLTVNLEWSKSRRKEIDGIKEESEEQRRLIEEIKEKSEELQARISEYEKLTTGYKDKIQDTYNFMNGQGLAHSFYERKKELDGAIKFWKGVLIISTVILASLIVITFVWPPDFLKKLVGDINNWIDLASYFSFRVFLFSPFIFVIWYSTVQYSLERREVSQYAFKGGVAKALENYTDLLTDKFLANRVDVSAVVSEEYKKDEIETKNRILNFTISCMTDIYDNPHQDKVKKDKENFSWENSKKEIRKFHDLVVSPVAGVVKELKSSLK